MHIHSEDKSSDRGLWFQNFGPTLAGSAGPIPPPLLLHKQVQEHLGQIPPPPLPPSET